MKELKFKVWDKDNNRWLELNGDTFLCYDNNGVKVIEGDENYGVEHENVEVVQYIQTINNYEIYVGYIVKAYKYGDKESEPFIEEIEFRNGTYWFGNWTWIEFLQTFRCVEVIGNKFEDLLQ